MKARVQSVSPQLARKWLDQSADVQQRGVRKNRVEKLAHAIVTGQWQVTHQGIALSTQGHVLDGQHRLLAIIQAGQAVEVLVTRDVPEEVFQSIDTGASRTPADSLKIAGHTNTNVLAAAIRGLLIYRQVAGTNGGEWSTLDRQVTTADILAYLDEDDNTEYAYAALKTGREIAHSISRIGATTPMTTVSLVVNTFPTDIGPTTIAEFNARLRDGVMLPARSPILALRRWLVADTGYVNVSPALRRPITIAVYLKALNDYALGLERSLSIFRFGSEPIPLPLPRGAISKHQKQIERELEEQGA